MLIRCLKLIKQLVLELEWVKLELELIELLAILCYLIVSWVGYYRIDIVKTGRRSLGWVCLVVGE